MTFRGFICYLFVIVVADVLFGLGICECFLCLEAIA